MIASSFFLFHLFFSGCKWSACCRGNGQATTWGRRWGCYIRPWALLQARSPPEQVGKQDVLSPAAQASCWHRQWRRPDGTLDYSTTRTFTRWSTHISPLPTLHTRGGHIHQEGFPSSLSCYQSSRHHHICSGGRGQPMAPWQPRRNQPPLPGPSLLGAQGSLPENPSDFVTHLSSHGKAKKTGTD